MLLLLTTLSLSFCFILPLISSIFVQIFLTIGIFIFVSLILFYLGLELIPLILLLVIVGGLLLVFIFALFVLVNKFNTHQNDLENFNIRTFFYFIFILKAIIFSASLDYYSYSQIPLHKLWSELDSISYLYTFGTGYGFMLLILAFLLFVDTVGISLMFKKK